MNSKGKDLLTHYLAKQIDLIFNQPQSSLIPIPWELSNPELNNADSQDLNTEGTSIQRRRKCPRLKHPDFLWTNSMSSQPTNHSLSKGNYFKIFHQNIRSLKEKHHELLSHLFPNLPHVLCLIEHHLKAFELQNINIDHYILGAQFCRTNYAQGGVVIYAHNSLCPTAINLSKYCAEKDIEICAVKLEVQ